MTRWNSFLRILLQLEFLGQLIFIKSLCRQDSIWQKTRSCLTQIRHLGHCIYSKDYKAWNHRARKGAHHICRRLDSYQYCSVRFFSREPTDFSVSAAAKSRQYCLRHTADKNIFFKKPHGFVVHTLFQRLTVLITFANVFKQEFFTQKQCKLFEIKRIHFYLAFFGWNCNVFNIFLFACTFYHKWRCPFCALFSFL